MFILKKKQLTTKRNNMHLTLYSIITPLKYHVYENIVENGAFALLEQMLHFPLYFHVSIQNLTYIFLKFFQCLKIENDVII